MPKTNHAGSTYYGHEGIVDHADGKLSQLDPSINYDGTVVDNFESDERELIDREGGGLADSTLVRPTNEETDEQQNNPDGDDRDDSEKDGKERGKTAGVDGVEDLQGRKEDQPQQSSAPEPRARRNTVPVKAASRRSTTK